MKHTVRNNEYDQTPENTVEIEPYGRRRAIMLHCTECMGFEQHPSECTSKLCALYPYRGKSTMAYKKEEGKHEK